MTTVVHSIGLESSLQRAHFEMQKHGIRHLPVLDGTKLVGSLSERELQLLRSFPTLDMELASVADAMSEDAYIVGPDTPLTEVTKEMAQKKYGSAIIAKDGEIMGIFTTIDALEVINRVLD